MYWTIQRRSYSPALSLIEAVFSLDEEEVVHPAPSQITQTPSKAPSQVASQTTPIPSQATSQILQQYD
jgi:hypothetical protein